MLTLKIPILVCILFLAVESSAQTENKAADTTSAEISGTAVYRLFPTQNMWTFLKLNTRNGRIWQVQYSVKDNRFTSDLNTVALVAQEKETNDRFTLYPTQNAYTFILLDKLDGRTWQVQWNITDNRFIIPIL